VSESENLTPSLRWTSILVVWGAAVVFAVVIGVVSEAHAYASWLALALGGCVVGAMIAQLATQEKEGFVDRLAASVVGAFVILGIAGAVLAVVAAVQ
jgi:hypothetical protein